MGLVLLTGVLLLNWLHWGALLTSLVVITILYFFFGDRVTIPLLMLPEYDPHFVMNYLGPRPRRGDVLVRTGRGRQHLLPDHLRLDPARGRAC